MATALVSALTRRAVRRDMAMTGEITLRGKVLPVGGIKDKALAAFRAGITELILPKENEKDLDEIAPEVREVLEVHLVESMDEVLSIALEAELASPPPSGGELKASQAETPSGSGPLAH
jgi:ATP-dependent Lon protease